MIVRLRIFAAALIWVSFTTETDGSGQSPIPKPSARGTSSEAEHLVSELLGMLGVSQAGEPEEGQGFQNSADPEAISPGFRRGVWCRAFALEAVLKRLCEFIAGNRRD